MALVDELAHTNAPGSRNEKRWQDVESLLDAGIDVMSTVNVQHIESLRDVVEQITGALQRETVPDAVLRTADQIEVIDLAPQSLRDRLAEGHVYPANRIDAALSNYFRLGNLTALRELALLWLADEVDVALKAYRTEQGIDNTWEARERVVVALTGGPEGETLIRRGSRIAARSAGGELIAVHITSQDGLSEIYPGALATQRALVEKLGGTYHQVIGDDIPRALVDFAKGLNATQLVIGVSRRSRLAAALTGPGTASTVIRESGSIDVHIVNHAAAGGRFALPHLGGALTLRRRIIGLAVALLGGPIVTAILFATRSADSIAADVLAFQLLVVLVALVGGIWPALLAAVLSGFTLDFLFVKPYFSITIAVPAHFLALVLYVVNAILVSYVVDQAARRSRAAIRALAESELLATITGSVFRGQDALQALVARTREAFSLTRVVVLSRGETVVSEGQEAEGDPVASIPTGERGTLELYGADLRASERRLLSVIAAQVDAALEYRELSETAREVGPLAEVDRVRSALLAAVGHDLRRPLAAATAAVTGLRSPGITWSDHDRDELLATAEESLESLAALVTNLLDVSRLQAGAPRGVGGSHRRRRGHASRAGRTRPRAGRRRARHLLRPSPGGRRSRPAAARDRQPPRQRPTLFPGSVGRAGVGEPVRRQHRDPHRRSWAGGRERSPRGHLRAVPATGGHRQLIRSRSWPRPVQGLHRGHGRNAASGGDPGRRTHHDHLAARDRQPGSDGGMKILIADDDPQILRALRVTLRARGYEIVVAENGVKAIDAAVTHRPDLVMLDLGMPGLDGTEVIQAIRGWSHVPILVISGRSDAGDKVDALDAGADDYVTKPFVIDELLARIRALTRRVVSAGDEPTVAFGDVTVDFAAKQVVRQVGDEGGRSPVTIRLTPTEWRILELLVRNPDKLITRESLLTQIWGPHHSRDTGYLRLYFAQLRKKLEPVPARPRYLVTVPGMGYRFMPDVPEA